MARYKYIPKHKRVHIRPEQVIEYEHLVEDYFEDADENDLFDTSDCFLSKNPRLAKKPENEQ